MNWINIKVTYPPFKKLVLVAAKERVFNLSRLGKIDKRPISMYVGYFDEHRGSEKFQDQVQKIDFIVTCGCSGPEHDTMGLEILSWCELPSY